MKAIRCHQATTRHHLTARDCNRISNESLRNTIIFGLILCYYDDCHYATARSKRARLHILMHLFKCYYSKYLPFDLRAISMH